MSTKIYDGCRLAEGVDVFDFTVKLRDVFLPIYEDVVAGWVVRLAAACLKKSRLTGEKQFRSPLFEGFEAFSELDRGMNFRLTEFVVAFAKDPLTGRIHARPYMDANYYYDAWYSLAEVERYGYWNNTDQPDDVSDEEWEERRAAWDRVFGWDVVSERALCFNLVELHKGSQQPGIPFPKWLFDESTREVVERHYVGDAVVDGITVDDLLGSK